MIDYQEPEEEHDERCSCGHPPSQHRWIRHQYRRPDTFPCDNCNCLDFEEEATQ